jgi:pilus assembly protein Flp/PilA
MPRITFLKRLLDDERGSAAVEYGLICAMIVIAMVGALATVGSETITMWDNVSDKTTEAMNESQ